MRLVTIYDRKLCGRPGRAFCNLRVVVDVAGLRRINHPARGTRRELPSAYFVGCRWVVGSAGSAIVSAERRDRIDQAS